jgi:hypothetical protein
MRRWTLLEMARGIIDAEKNYNRLQAEEPGKLVAGLSSKAKV